MAAVLIGPATPLEVLCGAGCPPQVLHLLELMTVPPGDDQERSTARIAKDPVAYRIKRAGLAWRPGGDGASLRRLDLWRRRWRVEEDVRTHPTGTWSYFLNDKEHIGLMRQRRWPGGTGGSWPEYLRGGRWRPGSPYELDAITGMGEDPYSCGEWASPISVEQAPTPLKMDMYAPHHPEIPADL